VEGPEQEGLTTLIPKEVVVEYVEEKDGIAEVSFSKEILNANVGSAGELLIMEQIAMIMDQFGYRKTQVLVEGEVVETLFGHMSADEPIQAGNPDDFEWADQ
jgi:spore germination protein GerM